MATNEKKDTSTTKIKDKVNTNSYKSIIDFFDLYYNKKRVINKKELLQLASKNKLCIEHDDVIDIINLIKKDELLERTANLWIKIVEIDNSKLNEYFRNLSLNMFISDSFNGCISKHNIESKNICSYLEDTICDIIKLSKTEQKNRKYYYNLIIILLSVIYFYDKEYEKIYSIYKKLICDNVYYHNNKSSILIANIFEPIIKIITEIDNEKMTGLERRTDRAINECIELREVIEKKRETITTLECRISDREKEISLLKNKIVSLENQANINTINFNNKITTLKGNVISKLVPNINLLKNGLLALQSSNPKPNVAIDHCDRVVESLSNFINEIKE